MWWYQIGIYPGAKWRFVCVSSVPPGVGAATVRDENPGRNQACRSIPPSTGTESGTASGTMVLMPGLSITFTDEEIKQLRARAKTEGLSMRTFAHDLIVKCNSRTEEDALIKAAYDRAKVISAELLRRLADK